MKPPPAKGEPLFYVDGSPCSVRPDGFNKAGWPYVVQPLAPGQRPTIRRLYTAADLLRRRAWQSRS